jgi:hypothetical protein
MIAPFHEGICGGVVCLFPMNAVVWNFFRGARPPVHLGAVCLVVKEEQQNQCFYRYASVEPTVSRVKPMGYSQWQCSGDGRIPEIEGGSHLFAPLNQSYR